MPKRLSKEGWRALKIYSPYGLCKAGGKGVVVSYWGAERGLCFARWAVIHPDYKTDPNGHWMDNGNKTFSVYSRKDKEPKRLEAIAWASARYGITGEWERDPWGDYHPSGTLAAALAAVEVVAG
jgi:hypothetical protein